MEAKYYTQKLIKQKNIKFFITKSFENMGRTKDLWKSRKTLGLASIKNPLKFVLKQRIMDNVVSFDDKKMLTFSDIFCHTSHGRIQKFWKGRALYVDYHGWPAKENLGFRWSKKAEITLETISFWQNISISIFKFSLFFS